MLKVESFRSRFYYWWVLAEPPGWALAVLTALPLVIRVARWAPPWPAGIAFVTAVLDLAVAMWVARAAAHRRAGWRTRGHAMRACVIVATALLYVAVYSRFTFTIPTTGQVGVKGFVCTAEARLVFPDPCPGDELEALSGAEYEADRIWKPWTIAVVRVALLAGWLVPLLMTSALAAVIARPSFRTLLRAAPPPSADGQPFVFMSYAHEDFGSILPVLRRLTAAGHRVWFDRGIPGATAWDQIIAQRVRDCRGVLAFLSDTAVRSKWVGRELAYADDLGKPILCVRLDSCQLVPPLDIMLTRNQMVEGAPDRVAEEFAQAVAAWGVARPEVPDS